MGLLCQTLCSSCTWISVYVFMFGNFITLILSNHFQLLFSFWNAYNANVNVFDIVLESPKLLLIFKHCFTFCCFNWVIFCFLFEYLVKNLSLSQGKKKNSIFLQKIYSFMSMLRFIIHFVWYKKFTKVHFF